MSMNHGCKEDASYETVKYGSSASAPVAASKQSTCGGGKLSPTKSLTPTHRIVTER